jgi:DNA-binding IclR family transcriptional regulator
MNAIARPQAASRATRRPAPAPEPSGDERPAGVKSALRVLTILEYFAATLKPATLAQLARQLDLPKSSCLALLDTLLNTGYLCWLGKDGGYYPTRRWLDLSEAISRSDTILALTAPALTAIRDATGETAILAKRENDHVVYLAVAEPQRVLRFAAHAGQIKPLHGGASGRALLAQLAPAARTALVLRLEHRRYTMATIVKPKEIERAVQAGIAKGYHVAIAEYQDDTAAVAAGFRFGGAEYAFVVGAPRERVAPRVDAVGRELAKHADAMARVSAPQE